MVRAFSLLAAAVPLVGAVILWRLARSRGKSSRTPSNKRTPKRLILVRHGESQGNIDHTIYEHTPDNALHLTERGWEQALSAGNALRKIISDETVCFFVSPYVRTRETLHAIARAFGGLGRLRWIEDPRIREQDFGNFQDPERTIKFKEERKRFGSFFYRFPDGGESAADVFDRVSSFMESMVRHWENHTDVENYVLVIHGVTISAFLMRFFKYSVMISVDEFDEYENFTNCEMAVLERSEEGRLKLNYCIRNERCVPEQTERARRRSATQCREMRYE